MNAIYVTGNWTIDPINMTLFRDGQKQEIRPKTFSLLMAFLQQPQAVLSKQTLLDSVWDDVITNDQVLFQTIRELRSLFPNDEVIKTVPRKGYCWTLPVRQEILNETLKTVPNSSNKKSTAETSGTNIDKKAAIKNDNRTKTVLLIISAVVMLTSMSVLLWPEQNKQQELAGTIMVLPIKNDVQGRDHEWVTYGMMTQLINSLEPTDHIAVADLNYTLSSLKLAHVDKAPVQYKISRLFDVSGAVIVINSELSGSIEDYRLSYNLHFKNDIKRGVLFGRTITGLVHEMAELIATLTHQNIKHSIDDSHNDFNNELMARAIEYIKTEQYDFAEEMLSSLLKLQPSNIMAQRLSAESQLLQGKFANAEQSLIKAIHLANTGPNAELARLYFFHALTIFNQQIMNQPSESDLDRIVRQASHFAQLENDWLYKAYISELKSAIALKQKKLPEAIHSAIQAKDHFEVIRCPIGKSRTLLTLADLYEQNGDNELSLEHKNLAHKLISQNKLEFLYQEAL